MTVFHPLPISNALHWKPFPETKNCVLPSLAAGLCNLLTAIGFAFCPLIFYWSHFPSQPGLPWRDGSQGKKTSYEVSANMKIKEEHNE